MITRFKLFSGNSHSKPNHILFVDCFFITPFVLYIKVVQDMADRFKYINCGRILDQELYDFDDF